MKATFKMLFFAQRARIKSNGKAPILARITINGKTSTFSTQLDIEPDRWDSKAQRTLGKTKTEKETNAFLDQIFATSQHSFFALQSEGKDVTAERIKQKVWGTEEKAPHTLRELSDLFIKDYEELVNANRSGKETLFRYHVCQNRVLEFVSKEYGMKDIPLDDVDKRFLDKFYLEDDMRVSLRDKILREMIGNLLIHREFSSARYARFIIERDRMYTENATSPRRNLRSFTTSSSLPGGWRLSGTCSSSAAIPGLPTSI